MGSRTAAVGPDLSRRAVVRNGFLGLGLLASGNWLVGCRQFDVPSGSSAGLQSQIPALGPLQANADANGLRLPEGFTSRVAATSGSKPSAASDYLWRLNPDGAAVFQAAEGG
ncbi:MAG: translocation protein TolB, partial [Myxococcota bacterium]|nr:translocation protein TolB [Myxococcota bacterium]